MQIPNAQKARDAAAGGEKTPAGRHLMLATKTYTNRKNGRWSIVWTVADRTSEYFGTSCWDGYDPSNLVSAGILIRRLETIGVEVSNTGEFAEDDVKGLYAYVTIVEKGEFLNVSKVEAPSRETLEKLAEMGHLLDQIAA